MSLQELINALQTVEQRQAFRQENTSEEAFAVGFKGRARFQNSQNSQVFFKNPENSNSGNSWQRRNWPNNQTQGNNFNARWKERREPLPTCKYCKKNNHLESSCWLKNVQCRKCKEFGHIEKFCNEDNANQAQVAEVEENKEEMLFTATEAHKCNKTEVNNQTWLIDSGCTNHMSADLSLFENLDTNYKSRVKAANGQYVGVEGKGEVKINTLAGLKEFENILYVPEIAQSLISVGQLLEDGFSLFFIDGVCTIKDNHGTHLFTAKISNRCFSIQLEHQSTNTNTTAENEEGEADADSLCESVELADEYKYDDYVNESMWGDEQRSERKHEMVNDYVNIDSHILCTSEIADSDSDGVAEKSVTRSYYFNHEYYDNPEHLKVLGDEDVGKCLASSSVVFNLDTKQVKRNQELELSASTGKFRAYIYSSPTMVVLNVDGNLDSLVRTSFGLFYVLDYHGNTRKNFPLRMAETQGTGGAADINDAEFRTKMKDKFEINELGPLAYCLGRKQCKMEMKDYYSREQWTDLITLAEERLEELRRMVKNVQLRNQGGVLKSGNYDSRPAQDYQPKEMITS